MIGLDENYYQTNKQNLLNNLPSDYCSVFTNEHYDENNNMSLVEYVGCVIPSENGFHEFYVEISEREGLVYVVIIVELMNGHVRYQDNGLIA